MYFNILYILFIIYDLGGWRDISIAVLNKELC